MKHQYLVSVASLFLFNPSAALAAEYEHGDATRSRVADPVSAGAAAVTAAVAVIGGLSSWIQDQSDDVAAYAYAKAGGKEHGYPYQSRQGTGYFSVLKEAEIENDCAWAAAQGHAEEGSLGGWGAIINKPSVWNSIRGAHAEVDEHKSISAARTSVDGEIETRGMDPSNPAGRQGQIFGSGQWDEGDIVAMIAVESLRMSVPTFGIEDNAEASAEVTWEYELWVDNEMAFESSAIIQSGGILTVMGDIPEELFSMEYDESSSNWMLSLDNFSFETLVGHADFTARESQVLSVAAHSNMTGSMEMKVVPTPGTLSLAGLGGLLLCRKRGKNSQAA
jgi:hypothetical protein